MEYSTTSDVQWCHLRDFRQFRGMRLMYLAPREQAPNPNDLYISRFQHSLYFMCVLFPGVCSEEMGLLGSWVLGLGFFATPPSSAFRTRQV
ncbi:hypothetical protein E2C01_055162 [Portunus trituberculatus]|uniref:Uncharacterized protein n=1 Tax=Portunus trituberculatus TaxID=210409 RepID=A0A5B7GU34_PORTR|nr:hypothetical protein [Portunus trituberculatus]